MSTDIKPGQVWAWAEDGEGEFTIASLDRDMAGYKYNPASERTYHAPQVLIREKATLVKDVDATPAPLDPSKVASTLKGGDYIEAESDGTKIGGKVSHVTERGFVAIEHLGEFAIHHITASPLPDGYRMFLLTAHQPAPEPEPEWKPGTVGMAMVSGKANVRVMRVLPDDRDPVARPWVSDHPIVGWLAHTESEVADFAPDQPRPLPTRDDLARIMHDDYLPNGMPRLGRTAREELAAAVLRFLRGEVR